MNRALKFRIWDRERKKISDPDHVFIDNGEYITNILTDSNRYVVMQYTGIKDCNDYEICEGDVLIVTNRNLDEEDGYFVCEWDDDSARFVVINYDGYMYDLDTIHRDAEIVGHVFDGLHPVEWFYEN